MDFFPTYIIIASSIPSVIFLLLSLISKYRKWKYNYKKGRAPPEAGGAWPIIGHLHLLGGGTKVPHIILGSLADKHGPIFSIRLGSHESLVVSSSELAREILTKHDVITATRPECIAAEHLGFNYYSMSFSPYGQYWREIRKITSSELLSSRRLELLKNIRMSETRASIKELLERSDDGKNNGGVLVDMKEWFGDLCLNVIVRMVVGKRFSGHEDDRETRQCRKVMREFFHLFGVFVAGDALPWLRWLDIGGHEKEMRRVGEEMDGIVGGWLEEHRRKKGGGGGGGEKDFMDVMLEVVEDNENFASFDHDIIVKATCMILISGGTDTMAIALIWALSLLLKNPHAMKKVQDELDEYIGRDRRFEDEEDIDKLFYLQAVMKETLRLYPAGPLGGPREFSEDCVVGDYKITKGTRLILNLSKIQRDPNVWPEPSEFKPERFLLNTHQKGIDVLGNHFELIPFGAGRRICPGAAFGVEMMLLVLANLLHAFEICTPFGEAVDMTESPGLTSVKATPLDVLVTPRLKK